MRVINIDDERRGDFAGVLPVEAVFGRQTILLGAVDENGFVQGALAVSEDPEQYTIDWLFVDPAVRRHGIGTMLIGQLDHMVNNVGIKHVRCTFEDHEENGLFSFFHSFDRPDISFEVTYFCDRYTVRAKEFYASERLRKLYKTDMRSKAFFALTREEQNAFLSLAMDRYVVSDRGEWEKTVEKELCLALYKGNEPAAFMIVEKRSESVYYLSFLYSESQEALYELLQTEAYVISDSYSGATFIFDAVFPEAEKLAARFFKDANPAHVYEAELL